MQISCYPSIGASFPSGMLMQQNLAIVADLSYHSGRHFNNSPYFSGSEEIKAYYIAMRLYMLKFCILFLEGSFPTVDCWYPLKMRYCLALHFHTAAFGPCRSPTKKVKRPFLER